MTSTLVPIQFVLGSRRLFAIPRLLDTLSFGLEDLIRGQELSFPAEDQSDGFRVLSAPACAPQHILALFPRHIIGGFHAYQRYYIEMEGRSYSDYLSGFSSKTRSTLNRKRRKLLDLSGGALDIREFRREDEVDTFMADAVPLSRQTYQTRLLDAGLPEGQDFIADMKVLARQDLMRAYILYVDGRAISYLYLPVTDGIVTYAHLGYAPDYAHLSAGTVLQMEVLQRLFTEQRYRYFDFTEGEGAHKKMFGTASVAACSFFLLRPSLANRLLIGLLNVFDLSVASAKRLPEYNGSLAYMRRILRG